MDEFSNNKGKETYTGINEFKSKKFFAIFIMLILAVLLIPKYSRTFEKEKTYAGPKKIQIDKLGNIYINMEKRIYKFDNEGN